jgi:hypothetical protein
MRTAAIRTVATDTAKAPDADAQDSPTWDGDPELSWETDDLVPLFDADEWPGHFGAARLGIP